MIDAEQYFSADNSTALDLGLFQATALDHKMQVDLGKHLGIFIGAFGFNKRLATLHRLAGFSRC